MVVYAAVCCMIILIIAIMIEKNIYNPLAIFSGIWMCLFYFQSLALHGLYATSDSTYSMMIVGVVAFACGYVVFRYQRTKKVRFVMGTTVFSESKMEQSLVLRNKVVYICSTICICFYLLDLIRISPTLLSGGLSAVRAVCQDPNSSFYASRSGIESLIRTLFVGPFSFALLPITAVNFFSTKKDLKMMVYCIMLIGLRLLTEGGRSVVAYFMLHIVLAFFFTGKQGYRKRIKDEFGSLIDGWRNNKKKRRILLFGLVLLVAIGAVVLYESTLARSGTDAAIHMYFYVSMQGQMFEIWANKVDTSGLYGLGLASLNGFLYPIIYIFKNLMGYSEFPGYWGKIIDIIQATDSEWQWMSSYGRANAFVSLFWFFYLDARLIGIAVGMFAYGMVCAKSYRSAITVANDKTICICILLIQGLMFSMVRMQFSNLYYAQAFIWVALMYRRDNGTSVDSMER